ncbi:ABC transporter transmembrane region [Gleimia coleocanis DSM 15436]|uniref:ABC transporter transmembrane region n=1 Tax=Gleimia coleocanis DSM 15436 TaxID=525245 RepID=C0W0X2_9ACTO|nr:ABC transporter ATP-binding protein [Gleimia coleocanis]EEH63696.1 ABC transporter transmembrane region [Gleimia coleocanis DSM 15436]
MSNPVSLEQRIADVEARAQAEQVTLPPVKDYPDISIPGLNPVDYPAKKFSAKKWANLCVLAKHNWIPLVIVIALSIGSAILMPLVSKAAGEALDVGTAITKGLATYPDLYWSLGWLGLIIFLIGVLLALQAIFESALWQSGYINSSYFLFSHTIRRALSTKENLTTGETLTTLSSDTFYIGNLQAQFASFVGAVSGIGFIAYLMFSTSVPLALVVLIGMPIMLGTLSFIVPKFYAKQSEQRKAQGELSALTTDMLSGLRVLRGIGGETQFKKTYVAQNAVVTEAGVQVAKPSAWMRVTEQTLPALLTVVIIGYGALLVFSGELTAGQLLAFYGYAMYLSQPMRTFSWFITSFTRARVSLDKFAKIASVPDVISDAEAKPENGDFDWQQVPLTEKTGRTVINPGEITALVSPDPTQTALLAESLGRLNTCETIYIGEQRLVEIPIEKVRAHLITSVATNHLFAGTLRDNVAGASKRVWPARDVKEDILRENLELEIREENYQAYPWPDDADPQLVEALKAADAMDILTGLPGGLDGLITEKGRSVSGGQRQRIALARALYANPDVLILIEPTSAVDSHTESRIAKNLRDYRQGKTTIIVTSSPLVLEICDRVVVYSALEKETRETLPTAIGAGTHAQLLADTSEAGRAYRQVVSRATGTDNDQEAEGVKK